MFRPIRKKKNELSTEDTKQILREARRGVLAVNGEDGYPYAIPINFIYDETAGRIYFHSSRTGIWWMFFPSIRLSPFLQ